MQYFTITLKPIFKIDYREKAPSLNNDIFFSNKRVLANSFADSQFTQPIQLVLNQNYCKIAIFYNTNKPFFKKRL